MSKILEVKNLGKEFHSLSGETNAIKDISLTVNEGEFIAIVGSSGCGKSTLLNIIAGLDQVSHGTIKITDGKKIGYMLQQDALFPWLTIRENVLLSLKIRNELTRENVAEADKLLESYNLGDFKNKLPSCLSGGMKQRVV